MAKEFPLEPITVEAISTKHRKIGGRIPSEETIAKIKALREVEPLSMRGQAPLIWDHAEKFSVYDADGNMWLDFSSGVLIANAGHGRKAIVDAIVQQVSKPLLTTYCFPNDPRIKLTQKLVSLAPEGLDKVFLLSTGAEGTECALKLMRTHGQKVGGSQKAVVVSFQRAFHGRTMGSQQMGGDPDGKAWIKNLDPELVQVPFPDGFRTEDTSFALFEKSLADLGVCPDNVAGVISETYQGGGTDLMPVEYAQALRAWCDRHGALLCFDEVQAGFGRCGRQWGFELYDIVPDLFCCGKGISSSLPLSAVIGRTSVLDLYGPNKMTSTHSGNPVCCAAALANVNLIIEEGLIENSARVGDIMQIHLRKVSSDFSDVAPVCHGAGLVAGLQIVKPGTKEPDGDLAWEVVYRSYLKGLLMFAPVGFGGGTVKLAPPLCLTEEAAIEGVAVIRESLEEALKG